MTAIEPFCRLLGIKSSTLKKEEAALLEVELFVQICKELDDYFLDALKSNHGMKSITEKENTMLEAKLTHLIINDILSTNEYNIQGIAFYTSTFQDVIEEIILGRNTDPSATFLRKLIELHRTVRRELYDSIIKKLIAQYNSTIIQSTNNPY